ncbi:glycoside hydrolase family 78 protein [Mucilaginibacter roseus]|uniref:alpha-L-rhamnosidase n=1 Tax=Mucilaginibacter roseus TaxID=1528868 RepID=A0ABS8TZM2_9SPHI|nr:glycoside hydrolase family 78 protein [Mucilaginibacter roseus]MCD8739263.1 glycoside hydrolase family 78 protein [Mucilaginibacter roseus]
MKPKIIQTIVFLLAVVNLQAVAQKLSVTALQVEHQVNPLSVVPDVPRMSWKLVSKTKDTRQKRYEIRISTTDKVTSGKNLLWKQNKDTEQSVLVNYEGPALKPGQRYYWQVRVKDNHGNQSNWSEVQYWQTGLKAANWKAKWIAVRGADTAQASPLFRKQVDLGKTVKAATAYITAKGLYEAYINGKKIGDAYFTPGWTSYKDHLQYQAYDVTSLLKKGDNALSAMLADGWYRGGLTWDQKKNYYGDTRALLMQINVQYTDGSSETIVTDESWKTSYGALLKSSHYNGEVYDARKEKAGWMTPGYNEDNSWASVAIKDYGYADLTGMSGPVVKEHERIPAVKIIKTPQGDLVADFGQNLVGWVEVKTHGPAGKQIKLTHAEVLDKAGNFYTDNLRSAKQQTVYVLKGSTENVYSPHFSFQGFRYVKIEGYPQELKPADLTAVALYSAMPVTGTFKTSNPLLNQLQHNIVWGQKGNFVDVPTDCPQRDERLGWTGDAQAFYNTSAYNMDVSGFFTKWLKDVKADQHKDGSVPFVVPDVLNQSDAGSAGWADVATIIPWGMYMSYGDKRILEDQYASMKGWVDYMTSRSRNNLWNTGFHFGDWLFYRPDDDNDGRAAVTDKYMIAQCFYANSTQLLANAAQVLGKTADFNKYNALLNDIKKAYVNEYVTAGGRLISSTQTAYVLALQFDMLPESQRAQAADRLVANVRDYGNHLTTGFLGTPYLCHVLSRFGHADVAYDLLMQESYPSWLYPVKMGATTIWERWDGIKPDGSFQTPNMNSYNHYAYGAIGDWMYKNIAGIQPAAPGYKKITIKPIIGGKLTSAEGTLDSDYGLISSRWKIENGKFNITVVIPPNTTADVYVPDASGKSYKQHTVASGEYSFQN